MSEPPSAASLFRDIQAHSLPELLTCVLHETSPLGSTSVPTLDEHLDQARPTSACKRGEVIEVQGPAASGKSHMLYYMLMNCVLPPSIGSAKLQGWGKAAVLLDTDHKFDVQRFGQLLRSRVKRLLPLDSTEVEATTTTALDLLHVFQPTSLHQLTATIQHLPTHLATNLSEAELGILAVDSISTFYWSDRYTLEQTRPANHSVPGRPTSPLNHVFAALRSFARSHGPLILLSSWDLSLPSKTQTQRHDASHSGKNVFPASYHITLGISSVLTDSTKISLTSTTRLSGTVRTPGNPKGAGFSLDITEDDMVVPPR